jgi:hypothetical protein
MLIIATKKLLVNNLHKPRDVKKIRFSKTSNVIKSDLGEAGIFLAVKQVSLEIVIDK